MMRRVTFGKTVNGYGGNAFSRSFFSCCMAKSKTVLNASLSSRCFLSGATYWGLVVPKIGAQILVAPLSSTSSLNGQSRWYSSFQRPSSTSRSNGFKVKNQHSEVEEDKSEDSNLNSEKEERPLVVGESGEDNSAESVLSKQGEKSTEDIFRNIRHHSFFKELVQRIQTEMPATRSTYETYSKDVVNTFIRPLLQLVDKAFTVDQLHQLAEKINPSVLRETLRTETAQRAYHLFFSTKLGTVLDWSAEDFLRRRYEGIHLSWEPMEVVSKRFNWTPETMTNSDILVYLSKFEHLIELARAETINGKPKALPIRNPLELARRGGISPSLLLIRRKPGENTEPSLTESIRLMGTSSLTSPSSKNTRSRRMVAKDSVPGVFKAIEESVGDDNPLSNTSFSRVRRAIDKVSPTRQAHYPVGRVIKEFSLGRRETSTPSANSTTTSIPTFTSSTSSPASHLNRTGTTAEKKVLQREVNDNEGDGTPSTNFNQYEFDNLCGVYHRRKVEISLLRRRLSNITSSDQSAMLHDRLTNAKKELQAVGEQLKILRALKDEMRSSKRSSLKSRTASVTTTTTLPLSKSYNSIEEKKPEKTSMTTPTSAASSIPEAPLEPRPTPDSSPKNCNAAVDQVEEEVIEEEEEVEEEFAAQEAENTEEEEMCSSTTLEEELSDVPPSSGVFSSASSENEEDVMECGVFTSEKESAAAELAASAAKEFEDDEIEQEEFDENNQWSAHQEYASRLKRQAVAARAIRVLEEEVDEDYATMQELERAEEELEMEGSNASTQSVEEVNDEEMRHEEQESGATLESCGEEVGERNLANPSGEEDEYYEGAEEVDASDERTVVRQLSHEEEQLRHKMEATQLVLEKTTREWLALEKRMKEALDLHNTRLAQFEVELKSIREREDRVRTVEERLTREEVEYTALKAAEERARAAEEKLQAEREATREAQQAAKLAQERQFEAEQAMLEYEKERMSKNAPLSSVASSLEDEPSGSTSASTSAKAEVAEEQESEASYSSSSSSDEAAAASTVEEPAGAESTAASDVQLTTKRADGSYSVSDFMCTPEQYDGLHCAAKRLRREIATLEREMEDGDAEDDETLMSVLAASRADLEELEECITSVQHNADWAAASDAARLETENENRFCISPAAQELQEAIDTHNFNLTLLEKRLHVATQRGVISKLEQGIVHARRELSRLRREQDRHRRLGDTSSLSGVSDSASISKSKSSSETEGQVATNLMGATSSCAHGAAAASDSVVDEEVEEEVELMEMKDKEEMEATNANSCANEMREEELEEEVEEKQQPQQSEDEISDLIEGEAEEEVYTADEKSVEEMEDETEENHLSTSIPNTDPQGNPTVNGETELKSLNCLSELKEMTRDLFEDFEAHTDEDLRATAEEEEEEEEEMKYEEAITLKRHLDTMVRDIQNLQRTILLQERNGRDAESATVMSDLKEKERQLLQIREDVVRRIKEEEISGAGVGVAEAVEEIPSPSTIVNPRVSGVEDNHMLSSPATPLETPPKLTPSRRMGMITKKRVYAR